MGNIAISANPTGVLGAKFMVQIMNKGARNVQKAYASMTAQTTGTAFIVGSVDTSILTLLEMTVQLGVGTDIATLEDITVEILRR